MLTSLNPCAQWPNRIYEATASAARGKQRIFAGKRALERFQTHNFWTTLNAGLTVLKTCVPIRGLGPQKGKLGQLAQRATRGKNACDKTKPGG